MQGISEFRAWYFNKYPWRIYDISFHIVTQFLELRCICVGIQRSRSIAAKSKTFYCFQVSLPSLESKSIACGPSRLFQLLVILSKYSLACLKVTDILLSQAYCHIHRIHLDQRPDSVIVLQLSQGNMLDQVRGPLRVAMELRNVPYILFTSENDRCGSGRCLDMRHISSLKWPNESYVFQESLSLVVFWSDGHA